MEGDTESEALAPMFGTRGEVEEIDLAEIFVRVLCGSEWVPMGTCV